MYHQQQQQQQYWPNQAHPPTQYAPYSEQHNRKPPPVFRSQAELGFELPPVRPSAQGKQQPMPIQNRPRPQSVNYQPTYTGYAPPIPVTSPARSSSSSPTRKPLPAPASPASAARPITVTQSSGFSPFPHTRPQSIDLSAFSKFNQQKLASGAITGIPQVPANRNPSPVRQYSNPPAPSYPQYQQQQQSPISNRAPSTFSSPPTQHPYPSSPPQSNFPTTPTRRRASPPRFFDSGGASPTRSRNNSPEKPFSSPVSMRSNAQPLYSQNSSSSPSRAVPQPPSHSAFTATSSAALRQRNPIFEPQSSGPGSSSKPTNESKFVPMWKRGTITSVNNHSGNSFQTEPNPQPEPRGRPLPQPSSPTRAYYTVEEPEEEAANSSFESDNDGSEFSAAASATSATSQKSGANNGPGILDLRKVPHPPSMDRTAATTGNIKVGGARSHFEERSKPPQPPEMDRAGATTGAIHEGGTGSMTLRFAKMGLDSAEGSMASWPQNLPPLPRGPGSGFSSGKAPSSSFAQSQSHWSSASGSSRHSHSHSYSQPQTKSAFGGRSGSSPSNSRVRPTERTRREPDYDLDEPPPRPTSASFSSRSVSPTGSTASSVGSTTGALERFRRNTSAQQPAQPQPQHAVHSYSYSDSVSTHNSRVKIESPSPLGGKEKIANVRKMESDSENEQERTKVPKITFGDDDGDDDDDDEEEGNVRGPIIRVSGPRSGVPRITFGNDDDEEERQSSGPVIRVSGEDGHSNRAPPPQIVFEVPGVGVGSQFGSGPMINVTGADEDDNDATPRRKQPRKSSGGPRAIPSARSGVSQMPGRGKGGLTCPACAQPIVGRIVGAMGMKWHPNCFRCTICDELLEFQSSYEGVGEDGIKRPYCHLDYHETFAPKCYHCKTAIVDERFISLNDPALGRRTYHEPHFFCAECGDPFLSPSSAAKHNRDRDLGKGQTAGGELAFSGDGTFSYDDDDDNVGFTVYKGHPYCEACHVRLRLPKCKRCKKSIRDHMEAVEALGGKWCWDCFRCTSCDKPFEDPSYFERDRKPYCENCFSIMIRNEL